MGRHSAGGRSAAARGRHWRLHLPVNRTGRSIAALLAVLTVSGLALVGLTTPVAAYQAPSAAFDGSTGTGQTTSSTLPSGLVVSFKVTGANEEVYSVGNTISNKNGYAATTAMFSPAIPTTTPAAQLATDAGTDCKVGAPATCTNRGTVMVIFSRPVTNPQLHIAGLGGQAGGAVLHTKLTLTAPSGVTLGAASSGSTNLVSTSTTIDTKDAGDGPACNTAVGGNYTSTAGCGSVGVIGTVTSLTFQADLILKGGTAGSAPGGTDAYTITATADEQFGDAPVSYDGTGGTSPAGAMVGDLHLGATEAVQNATVQDTGSTKAPNAVAAGASANAPNGNGTSDDAFPGSAPLPSVLTSQIGSTYALTVPISGASQAGRVCGWIDFDRGGTFDSTERACSSFSSGATSVPLSWTVPTATTAGTTYARFRASYDTDAAANATGFADSGEVEDYTLDIKPTVRVVKQLPTANDPGKFNLLVGGTVFATNVGDGGSTGNRSVYSSSTYGAPDVIVGTDVATAPVTVPFSETAGTGTSLAAYTSAYTCVNGLGAAAGTGTGTSGTATIPASVTGTLANGQAQTITCTLTNTSVPATIKVVKNLSPASDAGRFTLLVGGTAVATAVGNGGNGSTTAGAFAATTVAEAGAGSTSLAAYASTLACTDAGGATVTVSSNTGTSGSVTPLPGQNITCTFTNTRQPGSLQVTKTASTSSYSKPGDTITYSLVVKNTGPVLLTGVTVTDAGATLGTCTGTALPGTLPAGAATTCPATYTVTQADVDAGSYVNSASASGKDPNGDAVTSATSTATVAATQSTALSTTLTAGTASYAKAGDTISYTVTVTNSGNTTLSGVRPVDAGVTIGTCTPTAPVTLAPGASLSCPATRTVTQADVDAGSYTSTASATGTDPGGNPVTSPGSTVTTNAAPTRTLSVSKTSSTSSYSRVGDTISYSIVVKNTGTVTLSAVAVTDGGATVGTCSATALPGTLAPGASTTCPATHTVTQADIDAGSYDNTATAAGRDPQGGTVSAPGSTATVNAVQTSTLSVTKTSPTASYSKVGDTITYSIVVRNTGNTTLSTVTLTDAGAVVGSCSATTLPGTLAPGASTTCPATHTVTQADIDAGSYLNTASATAKDPKNGTVSAAPSSVTVPAAQTSALTVTKTTTATGYATVGQSLRFSIVVANTGNTTLTSVTLSDPTAVVGTCASTALPGTLAPGGTTTCPATHTVTQADIDNGSYTNSASATAKDPQGGTVAAAPSTVTVQGTQTNSLSVTKTSSTSSYSRVGDTISYSIVVRNTGTTTLTGVTVSDPRATVGTCSTTTLPGTLAPGATTTCPATHTVTQTDIDAGSYVNTAGAAATSPGGSAVAAPASTVTVPAAQASALTVSQTSPTTTYSRVGDTITYSVVVTNSGNTTLSAVTLSDPKAVVGTCSPTALPATLVPGASTTCPATHTVTQADIDAGSYSATASVSGTDPAGSTIGATSQTITTPATRTTSLSVTKSSTTPSYSKVGDTITYSIVVKNTGTTTLSAVTLSDPTATVGGCAATALPGTLAPGASTTCPATYTVTQTDLDAGAYSNTATATASGPGGGPVNAAPSTVTTPAAQNSALTVTKTTTATGYSAPGQLLAFSIVVTNSGNTTLSGVTLSDPTATIGTCSRTALPGALAPGASTTCPATHTVTQADVDAGSYTNTASASATDPTGVGVTSPTATVSVTGTRNRSLSVTKSALSSGYSQVGDVVSFSILVTNTGNTTLTGVTVNDPKAVVGTCTGTALPGTLAPGASTTCPATHTITQADIDAGSYLNSATASGTSTGGGSITSPASTAVVAASQASALTVSKTSSTSSYRAVGDVIAYSIVVTNSGNTTLSGVTLSDPRAVVGTCSATALPGTLAPGATTTCPATHTVTQADIDAGSYSNTASASGTDPRGNTVTATPSTVAVPAVQNSVLRVTKSSSTTSYSRVGDVISYSIAVRNIGNTTLSAVTVADPGAVLGTCSGVGLPATLAPGAQTTCPATHTVTQGDIDAGSYLNTAGATGQDAQGRTVSAPQSSVTTPASQGSALTVTKTSTTSAYAAPGDQIRYSIVVANSGNTTLSGVTLTDAGATVGTCSGTALPGTLPAGASTTCPATYTVTQADVDYGSYSNTATASGTDPAGVEVDATPSTATVNATRSPSLQVQKTTTATGYSTTGTVLPYRIVVTNNGNVTLTGVRLVDNGASISGCSQVSLPGTLAPGASTTCTGTHTVDQTDIDAGSYANSATAVGTGPSGRSVTSPADTATVPATQNSSLTTSQTPVATSYDSPGDVLSWQVTVTNNGNTTLTVVSVTDPGATQGDCSPVGLPGTLNPGQSTTCTVKHSVTQADIDAGSYTNTATASGTTPGGTTVTSPPSSSSVNASTTAQLTVAKTADESSYSTPGETVTFTVQVTNTGNTTVTGVQVTDPGSTVSACTPTAPASLAPGKTLQCTASRTVVQADVDAGSITNSASASGMTTGGASVASTTATATVPAAATPMLVVRKSTTATTYSAVGDVIGYSVQVTNDGNQTLTGLTVTDNDPVVGCTPTAAGGTLGPKESTTCSSTHTVTQADLDNGSYTDAAAASATTPDGTTVTSPTQSVTTPATQSPALSATQQASPATYSRVGQVISYPVLISNTGNVSLDLVAVTDNGQTYTGPCDPVTLPATLGPGQSTTCTQTHTVTQADLDAGSLTHTATATGQAPNGNTVTSGQTRAVATAVQSPALSTTMTSPTGSYRAPGDVISYSIVVTNTGNTTVDVVALSDPGATVGACSSITLPATLAPNASTTCPATHTVTQADIDAGSYINSATSSGIAPDGSRISSGQATVTTSAAQGSSLQVVKTVTSGDYDSVGDQITFSIVVTNTGNTTLTGLSVQDADGTLGGCSPVRVGGSLPAGGSTTCTATHTVTQTDIDAGSYDNTATASALDPGNATVRATPSTATAQADQSSGLSIVKTTSSGGYSRVGDTLTYRLVLTNTGNTTLSAVAVTDPGATVGSCGDTALPGTLAPGASISCPATHTVTQIDIDAGSYVNTAGAHGTAPDASPVDAAPSSVTVRATRSPDLSVTNTATSTTYRAVGDVITFSVVVTNSGNTTLSSVRATDSGATLGSCMPTDLPGGLAPGASTTCPATHTVTQADLDAGSYRTVAAATGSDPTGARVTAPDAPATVDATQSGALTVTKTTSSSGYAAPGDVLTYSIAVTNTGNVTLSSVGVDDSGATLGACASTALPGTLAPGAGTTCSARYPVTQADIDAGSYVNSAAAHGSTPSGLTVTSNTSTVSVAATQGSALAISKTTTSTGYRAVGDTLSYSLLVQNTGNTTLSGLTVSDPGAVVGTCTPVRVGSQRLLPGASTTCPATHAVTQADIDAGSYLNTATAQATDPTGSTITTTPSSVRVTGTQTSALTVQKSTTSTSYSHVGDVLSYSVVVANTGNTTLTAVAVQDTGATVGTCSSTVLPGPLAPGAQTTCPATHTVTQADIDAGSYVNNAAAAGSAPNGDPVQSNTSSATVPAQVASTLTATQTTSTPTYAAVGDVLSFTVTLKNSGATTLTGVTATDDGATLGDCTPDLPATLAPGETVSCPASYTVTQADIDAGSHTATAGASGTRGGSTVVAQSAAVTARAAQRSTLSVGLSASTPSYAAVGDVITYSAVVTNTGNTTLGDVTPTDTQAALGTCTPVGLPATLAPGATTTCPATHTVTQADIDAGSYANTVSVTATDPQGAPVGATSQTVTVPATDGSALTLDLTSPTPSYAHPGDVISYAAQVTNSGNTTLTGFAVTDPTVTLGACTSIASGGTLAPGATTTCSATHTVTQADIDAGSYTSTAHASASSPRGVTVTAADDSVTTPAVRGSVLALSNTVTSGSYDSVGDTVTFSVVLTNDGNTTLTDVRADDTGAGLGACSPTTLPGQLAPGASTTCTATHTVTQADLDAGSVPTSVSASAASSSGAVSAGPATATARADQEPVLTVAMTGSPASFTKAGQVITYTVTVGNGGNVSLSGVSLADTGGTLGDCSPTALPGDLAPSQSTTCTATHIVTQSDVDAGAHTSTVRGQATTPAGGTVNAAPASVTTTATPASALTLTQTSTPTTYDTVGQVITYSIVASNTGDSTLSSVSVADADVVLGTCTPAQPATLAPSAALTCPATHTVTQADIDAGHYDSTATASGSDPQGRAVPAPDSTVRTDAARTDVLTVTNTATRTSYSAVGDVISYSVAVSNDGNTTLSDVRLSDDGATLGSCTPTALPTTLAPGQGTTCSATHTVTQADIDAGSVLTTAGGSASNPAGTTVTAKADTETVPGQQDSELGVSMTSPTVSFGRAGDVISYTITLTNNGTTTLRTVTPIDSGATLGACTPTVPATLAPGDSVTCPASYTVTQADVDAGGHTNQVDASAAGPTGTVDATAVAITTPARASSALSVQLTADQTSFDAVGQVLTYTVRLSNSGTTTISGADLDLTGVDLGTCTPTGPPADLAPDQTITCTATHTVVQADLDAGAVRATVTGTGTSPAGEPVSSTMASTTVPAASGPALSVRKTSSTLSYAAAGDVIDYSILVTNTGNVTLTDVTVDDPAGVLGGCAGTALPGALVPGASTTCSATHTVTAADVDAGSFTNSATATGTAPDGTTARAAASSVTTPAAVAAGLTVTKTADQASFASVGQLLTYTIVVTNSGNVTLSDVTLVDATATLGSCSPVSLPGTLAAGQSTTCTATHTVTQADLDRAGYVNVATATARTPNGVLARGADQAAPVRASANRTGLALRKTGTLLDRNGDGRAEQGEQVRYTVTARNTGTVTLTDVVVHDPRLPSLSCTPAQGSDLAPGATITCTGRHTVTAADVAAGTVVNTATASAVATGCGRSSCAVVAATSNTVRTVAGARGIATRLPQTGARLSLMAGWGLAMLVGGAVLAAVPRRRRGRHRA